jgi:hypothetical protein
MEFEYEITADDYAAASILHYKLTRKARVAAGWILAGASLLVIGLIERERGLSPILLAAIGVWFLWIGVARTFPGQYFRRFYRKHYRQQSLDGKKYRAMLNVGGFQVSGDNTTWTHRWSDVSAKGEDNQVFLFYSQGILFIFAKRYLGDEEQRTLRSFAGLPSG